MEEELESRIKKLKPKDKDEEFSVWKGLYLLGSLGFVVAISLLICIWIGVYLDQKWHTKPWLTLISLFIGFAAAGMGSYELLKPFLRKKN